MINLIHVYKDNPTAGAKDGTEVSISQSFTAPITFRLDAGENETAITPLAIRCAEGYETAGTTRIAITGDSGSRFSLSTSQIGTFASFIDITDTIGDTNYIFYVKATSADTDYPTVNRNVSVKVFAAIKVQS